MHLTVDKVKPFTVNDNSSLIPLYVLQLTCHASDISGPYKQVFFMLNCILTASRPPPPPFTYKHKGFKNKKENYRILVQHL